jgi:hypothetical protein
MNRSILTALTALTMLTASCGEEENTKPACSTNAECGEGGTCNTSSGACTYTASCMTQADCAAGERCYAASETQRGTCFVPLCAEQANPDTFCDALIDDTRCDVASNMCVPKNSVDCATSSECSADQVCADVGRPLNICVSADCSVQPATFCEGVSRGATCDAITKRCVEPAPPISDRYAMIQDVSTDPAICNMSMRGGLRDAGTDLVYVEAYDLQVKTVSATTVRYIQGSGAADATDASIFDGAAPERDNNGCPRDGFTRSTALSLGCGGALFVEFIYDTGASLSLSRGVGLSVGVYSPFCPKEDDDTPRSGQYIVSLCDVPAGEQPSPANCTRKLELEPTEGSAVWNLQ